MNPAGRGAILLTGASGYLGGLVAATLTARERRPLLLPVRPGRARDEIMRTIAAEYSLSYGAWGRAEQELLSFVDLPPPDQLGVLEGTAREAGVDEIIHCAGCLDYFDAAQLEAVNVALTKALVGCAQRWQVRRFVYLSTAFSSGYLQGTVPERLHGEPVRDPTHYTRTKRHAEHVVAASGVPYLILRPSVVIGDSRDGHYSGKNYGLYQLWGGIERLLCREWFPELHLVGPQQGVNLLHQDAFQAAFYACYRGIEGNAIVNLVSRAETAPTVREIWEAWIRECLRPRTVYFYPTLDVVPTLGVPTRQRAFLALSSVNLEIVSHPWCFATETLAAMRAHGLEFADTTGESLARCQHAFVAESSAIQRFLDTHARDGAREPRIVDYTPAPEASRHAIL